MGFLPSFSEEDLWAPCKEEFPAQGPGGTAQPAATQPLLPPDQAQHFPPALLGVAQCTHFPDCIFWVLQQKPKPTALDSVL